MHHNQFSHFNFFYIDVYLFRKKDMLEKTIDVIVDKRKDNFLFIPDYDCESRSLGKMYINLDLLYYRSNVLFYKRMMYVSFILTSKICKILPSKMQDAEHFNKIILSITNNIYLWYTDVHNSFLADQIDFLIKSTNNKEFLYEKIGKLFKPEK